MVSESPAFFAAGRVFLARRLLYKNQLYSTTHAPAAAPDEDTIVEGRDRKGGRESPYGDFKWGDAIIILSAAGVVQGGKLGGQTQVEQNTHVYIWECCNMQFKLQEEM